MHPPSGPAWLVWLETTGVATAMRQWLWLYPAVEIAHILGFVMVVGAGVYFDLRLLGWSRRLPISELAGHLLTGARWAFPVIVATGVLMFMAHATEMAENPAFRIKLVLILGAVANSLAFHQWPFRSVGRWDVHTPTPGWARAAAVVSLLCWTGAIVCGRLLAYL